MRLAKVKSADHVGGLNLRKSPSNGSQIIDKLAPGAEIEVEDQGSTHGWLYARYKGQRGWVWGAHVEWLTHPPLPPDVPVDPPPILPMRPPDPTPENKWFPWTVGGIAAACLAAFAALFSCAQSQ